VSENLTSFLHIIKACETMNIPYAGWSFDESCKPSMLHGSATEANGCGAKNNLSMYTPWGKLFLENISCKTEFCSGSSIVMPSYMKITIAAIVIIIMFV